MGFELDFALALKYIKILYEVVTMNMKDYTFITKEDFVHYMHHLVEAISITLDNLEEQYNDLGNFIKERKLKERPKRVISTKRYTNFTYLLSGPVGDILNLFGDTAEFGISYRNYRMAVKKGGKELNIDYVEFTQEQEQQLNKVTTARNWGSHMASSLISSKREKVFGENLDSGKPIYIPKYKKHRGSALVGLYNRQTESIESYKELFNLLKEDYEKLTGYPCLIFKEEYEINDSNDLIIPRISAGIQTKSIKSVEEIKDIYNRLENKE